MSDDNKKDKLWYWQKFFVNSFWLSFAFLLLSTFLCIVLKNYQMAFIGKYFPIEAEDYNYLVILILGIWKILIFQFTLIPAVIIYLMRRFYKCDCAE